MTEVSVIMPVYNKADYLIRGLQSILDQNFRDFELLVINDGSTDNSLSIIEEFAHKDSRILVFDVPNGGVSKARNIGLDHASGKYITFIDADDYVAPEYLGNMYDILRQSDVDMVISGVTKYWANRAETVAMAGALCGRCAMDDILPDFAETQKKSGIYGTCVSKMYPEYLTEHIRFNEALKLAEDFDYYLRLYESVRHIYFDDKQYYFYLQEADNSSVKIDDAKIDYVAQFKISIAYRDFLIGKQSYSGANRSIVEQQISNYLFFSLHHCPKTQFHARFCLLRELCRTKGIKPRGDTPWKRLIFAMFRANAYWCTYLLVQSYHTVRRIVRGVR